MLANFGGAAPSGRRRTSGGEEFAGAPPTLVHELTRLRNELKVKDGIIEERTVEVTTLQRQVRAAEEGIQKAERELAAAKERLLSTEGDAHSLRKQLTMMQAERDALRRQSDSSERGALRSRDKELETMSQRVAAAESAQIRARDLESAVAALRTQLAAAHGEIATLQRQQAGAAQEVEEARRQSQASSRELCSTSDYLAGVMAELAAAQTSLQASRRENKMLQEQLHLAPGGAKAAAAAAAASSTPRNQGAAAVPGSDTAAGSAHAALQQAMQQLSLRTAEVQGLRRQLEEAQAAAAAVPASAAAAAAAAPPAAGSEDGSEGSTYEAVVTGGTVGSGPATPQVELAAEEAHGSNATAYNHGAAAAAAAKAAGSGPATPTTEAAAEAHGQGPAAEGVSAATEALGSTPHPTTAGAAERALPGSSSAVAAAGAAGVGAEPVLLQPSAAALQAHELREARRQVEHLQGQVATLRQHLAEAAAHSDDDEEEDSSEDEEQHRQQQQQRFGSNLGASQHNASLMGGVGGGARVPPTPAEQAAEERRRNAQRGHVGSIWFGSDPTQRQERVASATGLTKEALGELIDKLVDAREQRRKGKGVRRPSAGGGNDCDSGSAGSGVGREDSALWEEATSMLRGELIRLGQEAARKMEENEKLRNEVGELKTARMSAEATAARLEEMNTLSIRVASLKLEMAGLRGEQEEREEALLGQIAWLQAALAKKKKKRRSPGKMLRKAADAIRQGLSPDKEAPALGTNAAASGTPRQLSAELGGGNSAALGRTWGSLKSKFTPRGRASGKEEEPPMAAAVVAASQSLGR